MTDDELIALLVEKAVIALEFDDAYPDVGMGMFISTAIQQAEQEIIREAARWNSLAALSIVFTPNIRTKAIALIKLKR